MTRVKNCIYRELNHHLYKGVKPHITYVVDSKVTREVWAPVWEQLVEQVRMVTLLNGYEVINGTS